MKWMCLLLFGSVGAAAFISGVVWGMKRYSLLRGGVRTHGTVVELAESESSRTENGRTVRSMSYYPVVEFSAADGQARRFRGSTGSSSPSYGTGTRVEVIYDRDDPSTAQIADFEQFWLGPLGVGIFGFLFLVAGIGGFFLISDSDRTFGPAFEARIARAELYEGKKGIALDAVVSGIRALPGGKEGPEYSVICRGGAPGGTPRDFASTPLAFDPGPGIVGKPVTVYADPQDSRRFYVHLDPLFTRP